MPAYISGPMSGYEAWNFPMFYAAEERLQAKGLEVINPAREFTEEDLKNPPSWAACMRRILAHVSRANKLYMLPGWEMSRGAKIEVFLAQQMEIPIFNAVTLEPLVVPRLRLELKQDGFRYLVM